jgi:DNA-binding MarR family transcriptional regulator
MVGFYNLRGNGKRGKYAKARRENGYSITVHYEDGTTTTRKVSPSEVLEKQKQRQHMTFTEHHLNILQAIKSGSYDIPEIANKTDLPEAFVSARLRELEKNQFIVMVQRQDGVTIIYKVLSLTGEGSAAIEMPKYYMEINRPIGGDYVAGPKNVVTGTQNIHSGSGDNVSGTKIVNSQNLTQSAQDIKALLDQLAIDYPNEDEFIQGGRALSAIKKDPTLKTRLINAAKEAGIAAFEKTVEAITDNPAVGSIVAGIKGFIEADR